MRLLRVLSSSPRGATGGFESSRSKRRESTPIISSRVFPTTSRRSPRRVHVLRVARSARRPATVTLPAGGAAAPHQSLPLGSGRRPSRATRLSATRRAPTIVSPRCVWGDGPNDAGLEHGRNLTPIGALSVRRRRGRARSSFSTRHTGECFAGARMPDTDRRSPLDRPASRRHVRSRRRVALRPRVRAADPDAIPCSAGSTTRPRARPTRDCRADRLADPAGAARPGRA